MEKHPTFKIGFNPLLPTVAQQIKKQGLMFDKDECEQFENCRTALFNMSVSNLITEKQEAEIKKKLFSQIMRHVFKKNKLKTESKITESK